MEKGGSKFLFACLILAIFGIILFGNIFLFNALEEKKIAKIECGNVSEDVFNIKVQDFSDYFAEKVLVHNTKIIQKTDSIENHPELSEITRLIEGHPLVLSEEIILMTVAERTFDITGQDSSFCQALGIDPNNRADFCFPDIKKVKSLLTQFKSDTYTDAHQHRVSSKDTGTRLITLPSSPDFANFLIDDEVRVMIVAQFNIETGKVEGYYILEKTGDTSKSGLRGTDFTPEILKGVYKSNEFAKELLDYIQMHYKKIIWGIMGGKTFESTTPEQRANALNDILEHYKLKFSAIPMPGFEYLEGTRFVKKGISSGDFVLFNAQDLNGNLVKQYGTVVSCGEGYCRVLVDGKNVLVSSDQVIGSLDSLTRDAILFFQLKGEDIELLKNERFNSYDQGPKKTTQLHPPEIFFRFKEGNLEVISQNTWQPKDLDEIEKHAINLAKYLGAKKLTLWCLDRKYFERFFTPTGYVFSSGELKARLGSGPRLEPRDAIKKEVALDNCAPSKTVECPVSGSEGKSIGGDSVSFSLKGGCFLGDTEIETPEGIKKIKDIKIGDKIISYDFNKKEKAVSYVKNTFEFKRNEYLIINNRIKVTSEHPFYSNGKWIAANSLKIGNYLFDGEKQIKIKSINKAIEDVSVYNLEVEKENYFAEGILVHNKAAKTIEQTFRDASESLFKGKGQLRAEERQRLNSISEGFSELFSAADEWVRTGPITQEDLQEAISETLAQHPNFKLTSITYTSGGTFARLVFEITDFPRHTTENNKRVLTSIVYKKGENGLEPLNADITAEDYEVVEEENNFDEVLSKVMIKVTKENLDDKLVKLPRDFKGSLILLEEEGELKTFHAVTIDIPDENGNIIRRFYWYPGQIWSTGKEGGLGVSAGWAVKHGAQTKEGYGLKHPDTGSPRTGFMEPEKIIARYIQGIIELDNLPEMQEFTVTALGKDPMNPKGKRHKLKWKIIEVKPNIYFIDFYHAFIDP